MTTEDELNDLRERLSRLSPGQQAWLLEAVLADNRRRRDEEVARQQAAIVEFLEREKQQRAANLPPEAKREAG